MINELVIAYAPTLTLMLITVYLSIKLTLIGVFNLRDSGTEILVDSFRIYNQQQLRETLHKKLKQYYSVSNKVNVIIFALLGGLWLMYLLVMW